MWLRGKDFPVSYLQILLMGLYVSRNSIWIKTACHSNCLISLFLDLILKIIEFCFVLQRFSTNPVHQQSSTTCRLGIKALPLLWLPVCRGLKKYSCAPSPCQPQHLLPNTQSENILACCSGCSRGRPILAIVSLLTAQRLDSISNKPTFNCEGHLTIKIRTHYQSF